MERIMRLSRPFVLVFAFFVIATLSQPSFSQGYNSAKPAPVKNSAETVQQASSTLENLQTAYFTESYESKLYTEFATKADKEGYGQIASMFRAVARAEQIHAATKEALITKLGGTYKTSTEPLTVGTTKENLEFAKASETYESDVMYAGAIEQAQKDNNRAAEQAFRYGKAAEPGHLAMFKQVLESLDGYRGDNIEFLVCPLCGTTVRTLHGPACPTCSTPRDKFEKVR
jgi:rubrerythrin